MTDLQQARRPTNATPDSTSEHKHPRPQNGDPKKPERISPHRINPDYAIFRREGRKNERTGYANGAGWSVNLSRGGRMIQTSFHDRTYGSKKAALHVARAYRDAVLEVVPPLTKTDLHTLVRSNRDPSSIPGVHYQKAIGNRPDYWIARIEVPADARVPGYVDEPNPSRSKKRRRCITRSFSIKRFGNDTARRMAEAERPRMLQAIEDGHEPALRSEQAKELHAELRGTEGESGSGKQNPPSRRSGCSRRADETSAPHPNGKEWLEGIGRQQ